ncbi:MAG TPA: YIP1 family protein [Vicinamibacterales bacterium]|jgi:hypothetical protein
MANVRFCSKCGASLFDGEDRCRLCRTPLDAMTFVAPQKTSAQFDSSPFVGVWLNPRDTMRSIISSDPTYMVIPLAAAGGIMQALDRAVGKNAGDVLSLPVLLLLVLIAGPIGGIIGLHIGARLLHFTGKWLGGAASPEEIRAAVAWGGVPALWGALLWVPILLLSGSAVFTSDMGVEQVNGIALLLSGAMILVQVGTALWSAFTGLHTLGEVQGFSAWKAFCNGLLAGLVVLIPLLVIGFGLVLLVAGRF